jgi:hypothetical protein
MPPKRPPRPRVVTKHGLGTAHRRTIAFAAGASPLLVDALIQSAGHQTWTA